jgi:hypothetical protein
MGWIVPQTSSELPYLVIALCMCLVKMKCGKPLTQKWLESL